MVVEALMNPFQAEKHPLEVLALGFIYATIALFLALWVFEDQAGLVMVFLTVMAALPLFYQTMIFEEKKDFQVKSEWGIMKEHSKALVFFMVLFIGFSLAFTVWYTVLPENVSTAIFQPQIKTINGINKEVSGNITGLISDGELFRQIFFNNIKVMIFSLFFSLLYGSGAIFVLTWNASVISAAFGKFINLYISYFASNGSIEAVSYFKVVSLSLLRYSLHGIPEILAYFVSGLAGGILSVAIIRKDFSYKRMEKIMLDFSNLVILAIVIVLIAGVLEVYVTPLVFSLLHEQLI
ncbi:MAG: stage II sporulation protein M [Nanoarchaeota archaeon]